MQKAATTEELQTAIEEHIAQTEGHVAGSSKCLKFSVKSTSEKV
jgi:ferritin-like metal-binding protein YciE